MFIACKVMLEDLDSLSLKYWLTKFVQNSVANKNGGLYEIFRNVFELRGKR